MIWKWSTLILSLILLLIFSFGISQHIKFKKYMHKKTAPIEKLAEELNLSDSQKKHCEELHRKHKQFLEANFQKSAELQEKLDNITCEFGDIKAAKEISQQISHIEQSNRDSMIELLFNVYSVLDDNQKEIFKKKHAEKIKKIHMFRNKHNKMQKFGKMPPPPPSSDKNIK